MITVDKEQQLDYKYSYGIHAIQGFTVWISSCSMFVVIFVKISVN